MERSNVSAGKILKTFMPILCSLALSFTGCAGGVLQNTGLHTEKDKHSATIFAMDTVMDLTVYGDASLLSGAESIIREYEGLFSVTDEKSDIYKLNGHKSAQVDPRTAELVGFGKKIGLRTGGALDITVYPVVRAWGFTTQEYRVPDAAELSGLLEHVDFSMVSSGDEGSATIPEDVMIDLGSIAKGYTGDAVIKYFMENGAEHALISLGGNVQALGSKPDGSAWKVAIADPSGDGTYAGSVNIIGKCVITSGAYERCFEKDGVVYHHIIDPSTGYPANSGFSSVSVIGESGALCDALSTALFVMGPEKAFELYKSSDDFEAVFITTEGKIYVTAGISDSFTALGRFKDAEVTVIGHD